MGKYEDLERLERLKNNGTITEDEFNEEKLKILNSENQKTSENNKATGVFTILIIVILIAVIGFGSNYLMDKWANDKGNEANNRAEEFSQQYKNYDENDDFIIKPVSPNR